MPLTNLDFRLGDEPLDLSADTSVQLEINSPLFETDALPGTLTYPFTVPDTPRNRRLLEFPGYLARQTSRNPLLAADLYLLGVRWRRGQLRVLKRTAAGFELNFQTDVGDVSTALTDLQLADLALPTVAFDLAAASPAGRAYALPTIANPLFVPADQATAQHYQGLVNAYVGGYYDLGQPLVPLPYLRTVLDALATRIGYELAGGFLADAELQRLLVYSNQAADPASPVALGQHLPDQSVPDFLKAIRALLGQCWVFDPVRRRLEIDALRDVLADARYVDWSGQAEDAFEWEPNTTAGFWLVQQLDGGDELSKNAPAEEHELKLGGATEKIEVDAGTLAMQLGPPTAASTGPATLLPLTVQHGNSPGLPGKDNRCTLRLLFDRGLHADLSGNLYPLASAEAVDAAGASTGSYSLRWGGPKGLYAQWHQPWLDFRSRTEVVRRGIRLRLADLLALDPRRKVLVQARAGTTLALWQQIQVTISQQNGLEVAQVTFCKL